MEPLRLLFGLLFGIMSVGVLTLPIQWPFNQTENTAPTPSLETTSDTLVTDIEAEDVSTKPKPNTPIVKLASTPTPTVLSVRPIAPNQNLADQISMAKYLSAEKQFDDALDVLAQLPATDQDKYEVVFLRARILSWAGRHQAAEQKFHRLMEKYPANTDLMVSYGYLQYYQGKNAKAEIIR